MKKHLILVVLLICSSTIKSWGQTDTLTIDTLRIDILELEYDTLKISTFNLYLDLMLNLTNIEAYRSPDIKSVNIAVIQYVLKDTELRLYFRQILNKLESGYLYYNNYLNITSDIFKYRSFDNNDALIHSLLPTPVFIYQSNSGKGLSKRFQTGLFFFPIRKFDSNLKLNFGVGCLYDWSSWEVNDAYRIEASPPAKKEKILFINSNSKLRDNLYMDLSEFRPTLYLDLNYIKNDVFNLGLILSCQQSLVSPYKESIKAAYPELKNVYPYLFSNLSLGVKLYKGISLKSSFMFEYEINNRSLYNSSWEYHIVFGIGWSFSNDKFLPVAVKRKKNI